MSTPVSNQLTQPSHEATPTPKKRLSRAARKRRRREISQTYWAQEQDDVDSGLSLELRMELLAEHGDFSLAYSTAVQPRLEHFGDQRGYLAFRRRWGMTFALGDPVAAPDQTERLLAEFIRQHKRISFCQISQPIAKLLSQNRFFVNQMGVDTTLDLDEYSLAGKQKEWLRYAANWTTRRGYQVVEATFSQIEADQIEAVSEAWRKTRTVKRKEVRFLNRPIVMHDEPGVRKFFLLSPSQEIQAFVFLDPLYRDGQITGYVTTFKRRHPESPQYGEQAIMKHVIDVLKKEGVGELKLGLSPLVDVDDQEFRHSQLTRWMFQRGFQARWVNRYCYNLIGHAEYKRRFRGREEKVYFASPTRFNSTRMMALIGLCGIA